jgi:hypothetical protein
MQIITNIIVTDSWVGSVGAVGFGTGAIVGAGLGALVFLHWNSWRWFRRSCLWNWCDA